MPIFYSLEEAEGSNSPRKVRVEWDTDDYDYDERSDGHWSYRTRIIKGVGEDGSEWKMMIDIEEHLEDWYEVEDAELSKPKGSIKELELLDVNRYYDSMYWDDSGQLKTGNSRNMVSPSTYFRMILGKYPNIDVRKGPNSKRERKLLKDPQTLLKKMLGTISSNNISDQPSDKKADFIRVEKDGKTVVEATPKGIINNLLNLNNANWYHKTRPEKMSMDELDMLKKAITRWLLAPRDT